MRRVAVVIGLLLAVLVVGAAPGGATVGGVNDGAAPDAGAAELDVKSLAHDDTGDVATGKVTYTLTSWTDWTAPFLAFWQLDFDGDGNTDAIVSVFGVNGALTGQIGATTAEVAKTGNVLTVRFNRSALEAAGLAGRNSYKYRVFTFDHRARPDFAPNQDAPPAVHQLSAAGSPPPSTTSTTQQGTTVVSNGNVTIINTGGRVVISRNGQTIIDTGSAGASTTSTTAGGGGPGSTNTTSTTAISGVLNPNCATGQTPATVSPSTAAPGQRVTVSGGCFAPNADLTITFLSDPVVLGTIKASALGTYTAPVTIPATATLGAHRIVVTGAGAQTPTQVSTGAVTVSAASSSGGSTPTALASASGSALPRTGSDAGGATLVALMAIAIGTALVVWTRRPRLTPVVVGDALRAVDPWRRL